MVVVVRVWYAQKVTQKLTRMIANMLAEIKPRAQYLSMILTGMSPHAKLSFQVTVMFLHALCATLVNVNIGCNQQLPELIAQEYGG